MVLKTLEAMGLQHGYGFARRIEQTSGDAFSINYGSLYPALLMLEQEEASPASGSGRPQSWRGSSRRQRKPDACEKTAHRARTPGRPDEA